ncbi:hypothetical protein [Deinococcus altitudinis]|uniref:hypothetical protein n=1 Tax=Deinococcus altitudinis TaxID=468914 RepID=UPI0038917038
MKKHSIFFLSSMLPLVLAACGGSSSPVVTGPTTFDLGITVSGVSAAPVKVLNSAGEVKFADTVTGSKTLSALPKDKYTVVGGAVANFTAPAPVLADLGSGNGSATLVYASAAGQVLSLDKIQGVLIDPLARGADLTLFNNYTKDAQNYLTVLETVTVGLDGRFAIPLVKTPPAQEFFSFSSSECSFQGSVVGASGKVAFYSSTYLDTKNGDPIGDVYEVVAGTDAKQVIVHVYADSPQTYQGKFICKDGSVETDSVVLTTGWNALIVSRSETSTPGVFNFDYTTASPMTRVETRLVKYDQAVDIFLDPSALTLKAGGVATVNAVIYQVGGVSGKIDLRTDVPGVTVEPSSVTLPTLGTQAVPKSLAAASKKSRGLMPLSVSAQRLSTTLTFRAAPDVSAFTGTMNLIASQGGALLGKAGVALNLIIPGVTAAPQSGQTITIERGQSVAVDVQVTSRGQYSGDVQVGLEGLPEGLTATAAKVNFTGSSDPEQKSVQVTVTASGSVAGGTVPAQLVVTAGGKVTRSNLSVSVLAPAVVVNFDQADNGFMYQGQQKSLAFTVKSVHGFNTPVTLNLTGLPEGVTADPVVVPVTANQESRGVFVLRTTAGFGYGTAVLAISGNDLSSPTTPTRIEIRPATLSALSADPVKMVTAHTGVWLVGAPQADVTPGRYQVPIRRVTSSGVALNITLPTDSGYISALGSPNGDLVILGSTQILRVKDDGSSVVWTYQNMFSISSSPAVVDAQNQLWFYIFGNGYQLLKYNLDSGVVQAVRSESSNNGKTRLYRSVAGDFIYVTGTDTGSQVRQFKTATGESKLLNIPVSDVSVLAYAVSPTGSLWLKTDSSLLTLTSGGAVTSVPESSVADSMVFDGAQTLWITKKNNATLTRVDAVSQKTKTVPVGTTNESSPAAGAGLWLISAESAGSNNVYLSLIP